MKASQAISASEMPDDHALSNHVAWLITQVPDLAGDELSRARLEGDLSLLLELARRQEQEVIESRVLLERAQHQLEGRMDQ